MIAEKGDIHHFFDEQGTLIFLIRVHPGSAPEIRKFDVPYRMSRQGTATFVFKLRGLKR